MGFGFNWRPQQIPTQMKGAQFAPQKIGLDQDFPSLVNGAIGRSPEDIAIEQNLNERQVGNANDMANWIQQGGTPVADAQAAAAQQAEQEAAAKQQRIAEIEAEITEIKNRMAERKMGMAANEDDLNSQLASIEARKINSQDPTMFWRWKVGQDQQRELAKQANSSNDTAKANAMIEIANDLDSIIVDDKMDSATQKTYLSKLANLKTLGEKAGVPKSVIDNINAKIAEVKGENKKAAEEKPDSVAEEDFDFEGTPREQGEARASKILGTDPSKLTQNKLATLKRDIMSGKISVSNETKNKIDKLYSQIIDRDKKNAEDMKKEDDIIKRGKGVTSSEIEWMKGRKNVKLLTDSYGNQWFERVK